MIKLTLLLNTKQSLDLKEKQYYYGIKIHVFLFILF